MEPLSDGTPKKEKTKKKRKFTNSNDSHDIYMSKNSWFQYPHTTAQVKKKLDYSSNNWGSDHWAFILLAM